MNKQNQKRNIKNDEISMVATDLDGTLLLQNKHISKRTYATLKKANENGVHIVIATGRSFSALPESIFKIDGVRYVVTSNGANIVDLKDEKVIYRNCIDAVQIPKIIDFLQERPYILEVFTGGKAYMSKSDYDRFKTRTIDPNLIRASLGSVFTRQVAAATGEETLRWLRSLHIQILTAQLQDSSLYYDTDMRGPTQIGRASCRERV